ncbi:MAG: ATP synthase F1 subunit delta [Bryobacteraceae bacterium]
MARVASRYAAALVEVVTADKSPVAPERAVEELRAFRDAAQASEELRNVLASPAIPPARKRAVIRKLGESMDLSLAVRNFLYVVVDHRRTGELPEMAEAFETLLDARLGVVRASATTAYPLSGEQADSLKAEFGKLTGSTVRLESSVDPSLIGGVRVRIGSTVYDGSVRGRLEALGRRLRGH